MQGKGMPGSVATVRNVTSTINFSSPCLPLFLPLPSASLRSCISCPWVRVGDHHVWQAALFID